MVRVRVRKDTKKLFFDIHHNGVRAREYTALEGTRANRKKVETIARKMTAEMEQGTFEYRKYFPSSQRAAKFDQPRPDLPQLVSAIDATPLFKDFADTWFDECEVTWRYKTKESVTSTLQRHLLPAFGEKRVSDISKADVLAFRAALAKVPGRNGNQTLSPKTINHTLGVLKQILTEAADRFEFTNPMSNIKRLRQQRKLVEPFSLDEVRVIIDKVRPDYRNYLIVRFFTGMRTGEVHGLRWCHVDFDQRQILVREAYSKGRVEYTKTDGSQREIEMSSLVLDALREQHKATGKGDYVFVTRNGQPLDVANVVNRVWYPLLRHLGLPLRRAYNTRHTAATLWLASGENPEWIARQLGHTTTEMLFRVYSRFVPNLTRKDGSAFDRFVTGAMQPGREVGDDE
jgi:integrase